MFLEGWMLCDVGEHKQGFELVQRAVRKGYALALTLSTARQFDPLRSSSEFQAILAEAEAARARASRAFHAARGDELLGAVNAGEVR